MQRQAEALQRFDLPAEQALQHEQAEAPARQRQPAPAQALGQARAPAGARFHRDRGVPSGTNT